MFVNHNKQPVKSNYISYGYFDKDRFESDLESWEEEMSHQEDIARESDLNIGDDIDD